MDPITIGSAIAAALGALVSIIKLGPSVVKAVRGTGRQMQIEDRKDEEIQAPPSEYHREKAAHEAADASARAANKGAK